MPSLCRNVGNAASAFARCTSLTRLAAVVRVRVKRRKIRHPGAQPTKSAGCMTRRPIVSMPLPLPLPGPPDFANIWDFDRQLYFWND